MPQDLSSGVDNVDVGSSGNVRSEWVREPMLAVFDWSWRSALEHQMAGCLTVTPRLLGGLRLQRSCDAFSDIAPDERLAEHIHDPYSLRSFVQLRTTVAACEDD